MSPDRYLERGQALILTALFLVVLMVAAALTIDYSGWLVARRDYQAVVDAAALAGASQLPPPGVRPAVLLDQQNAATEALVYLSDHLAWGLTRDTARVQATGFFTATVPLPSPHQAVQQTAPFVVTTAGSTYCVWIWTPTPTGAPTEIAGSDPSCHPSTTARLYAPANYPNDPQKVFVAIESRRAGTFSNVVGIASEQVGAIAVAGTTHSNYAVETLKPRNSPSDNFYGITISGNGSTLRVPIGDVGGNYTLQWSGTGSRILFPDATLSQVVDLEEPLTVQGNGSVVGGILEQLGDYPIPDPDYFTQAPLFCTGTASTEPCQEPNSIITGSVGRWGPPPSTGGTNRLGAYPLCARPQDINAQVLDLSCLSAPASFTIYPGQYSLIKIPGNTTVTMSHYCFGDSADLNVDPLALATPDSDCINNNRAGVYYFNSSASNSGLYMTAGAGSPSSLTGCGVLAIFDPYEQGGSRVQLNVGGSANTLSINSSACNMKIDQGNGVVGTTPFVWYGYNDPFTNPVSIWVRKTGIGYGLTNPQSGSHVITMGSGSTIQENGVIYAPEDNTIVSGGPFGSGVGQIVAWTITYTGNSTIEETYQGPGLLRTRLWQ